MPVSNTLKNSLELKSSVYTKLKPKWDKTRIIYEGEDSVHDAGEVLLPKLAQQDATMYGKYVARTRFLNAYKRTISGLEGTVKRRDPDVDISMLSEFEDDIDTVGTSIFEYSNLILHEGIKIGVCGTLVDYNYKFDNEAELTVAEVEATNSRPVMSFYRSDDIYRVEYGVIGGRKQITLVVLKETYKVRVNEFESDIYDQYRVLRINLAGNYEQQLYKITEAGTVDVSNPIEPEMNSSKMKEIPFFIHGSYVEPPLYDLVTTNIKHYQLKADHNHALHYIGLPTPYRTGVDPKDKDLPTTIGPEVIWDIENEKAKCAYLEFEGKGLDHITGELETIKEEMAFLGAAILASDQMINETATKANIRNASETSSLADIVINLSDTFTKALQLFAEWAGKTGEVYYYYNDDFDVAKLSAQDLLARVQAWQSGAYSKQSLFKQLKDGEIELVGETFEDEEDLNQTTPPTE